MNKHKKKSIYLFLCLYFLLISVSYGQAYDSKAAERYMTIARPCINTLAPEGGNAIKSPWMLDLVKQICRCVVEKSFFEKITDYSVNNLRFRQINTECRELILSKNESEALSSYNEFRARKNLPPLNRFPWNHWLVY